MEYIQVSNIYFSLLNYKFQIVLNSLIVMDGKNVNGPFYFPMLTPDLNPNLNVSISDKRKINLL